MYIGQVGGEEMPTEKPRVTITMSEAQLAKIEDYRFGNKIKNQTQAILSLIENGIEFLSPDNKKSPSVDEGISAGAMEVARAYDKAAFKDKNVARTALDLPPLDKRAEILKDSQAG